MINPFRRNGGHGRGQGGCGNIALGLGLGALAVLGAVGYGLYAAVSAVIG